MPRTYVDKFSGHPLFTNEAGVGAGMQNDPHDVMLIQFFLRAILHSNKIFLAGDTRFTPPPGPELMVTGSWDETSKAYLSQWERLIGEARGYWAYGKIPPTQFPGTVVPYYKGGKKIRTLNEMCANLFGADNHARLKLPNAQLPIEVMYDLFWDSIRGPGRFDEATTL